MNLCRGCGRDFGSVESFDAHRTGPHAGDRRCLTDDELDARRFVRNAHGRLTLATSLVHARSLREVRIPSSERAA